MKSYRTAALLTLALSATLSVPPAHAARDESLIQQTRKNQLAHDARVKKAQQDRDAPQQQAQQASPQAPQR